MLLRLNPDDPRPVYRQIADEIQRCAAVGVLKAGEPIPAVRALAAELKVNANTVQHAYRTLEAEGTVEVRRGLGTFIKPSAKPTGARQVQAARQIAERALREAYRHGVLASELMAALQELAPAKPEGR
jgi:GntR family transcriptional regulator